MLRRRHCSIYFFFNDTATTEIYTLSLHDALPICRPDASRVPLTKKNSANAPAPAGAFCFFVFGAIDQIAKRPSRGDRKSTRLNSSHDQISYAVFCLKKKRPNTLINTSAIYDRRLI